MGEAEGTPETAGPNWDKEAAELHKRLAALEGTPPRRDHPWWLLLATGIASAMLPVATLVHSVYQSDIEGSRRQNELDLAAQNQRIAQEKDWLEIAVDANRAEAQRDQVLRFLAKGDGRVGEWAREESTLLKRVIDQLKKELENTKQELAEATAKKEPAEQLALAQKVDMELIRFPGHLTEQVSSGSPEHGEEAREA